MTEDNGGGGGGGVFQMSPPVVSVNETSCDSITNEISRDDDGALSTTTRQTLNLPPLGSSQQLRKSSKRSGISNSSATFLNKRNDNVSGKSSTASRTMTKSHCAAGSAVQQRRNNHAVQSRLPFSRSPSPSTMAGTGKASNRPSSPALLYEGDRGLEDFIIEDTAHQRHQRKIKKPRQSQINFTANATSSSATNNKGRNDNRTSSKQKARNRKSQGSDSATRNINLNQRRIPSSLYEELIDIVDNDGDEDESENTNTNNNNGTGANARLSGPIFRIRVRISNHCFLVPCQQANEKTIGWLIEQVTGIFVLTLSELYILFGELSPVFRIDLNASRSLPVNG